MPTTRIATGLYTNWDSVIKISRETVGWIRNSPSCQPRIEILRSKEEAIHTLQKALEGEYREFIVNRQIFDYLCHLFPNREKRLGGNGFHMGRALFEQGFLPVVSFPYRPPSILRASPPVDLVKNCKLVKPHEAIKPTDPEFEHIVFEFQENISLGIESSGRHILSFDKMSSHGEFDYDFLEFIAKPKNVDVLVLGYAHLLLAKHKKRTDYLVEFLNRSRRPAVHLEIGQGCMESMRYAMDKFVDDGVVDSFGLNEKEAISYMNADSEKPEDLVCSAFSKVRESGLKRICIHTPTLAIVVSRLEARKELEALKRSVSYAVAMTYGKNRQTKWKYLLTTSKKWMHPVHERTGEYNLVQIDCPLNQKPKVLTGLGDAFASTNAAFALD